MTDKVEIVLAEEDHVVIGAATAAAAGKCDFLIPGGLITVDPAQPESLPRAVIFDAEEAHESLAMLYGQYVADLALTPADLTPSRTCHVEATEPMSQLQQLASVRWARLLSPLPLDDALLEVEECFLVGALTGVVDAGVEWLEPLAQRCAELIEVEDSWEIVDELLVDSLETICHYAPVTTPQWQWAQQVLPQLSQKIEPRRPNPLPEWLSQALQPEVALAAHLDSSRYTGKGTVDWYDVPKGHVSRRENNIDWALHLDDDSGQIEVLVAGPEQLRRYGQQGQSKAEPILPYLAFDAYLGTSPFPISTGRITFDAQRALWHGAVELKPAQLEQLRQGLANAEQIDVRVRAQLYPRMYPAREAQAQRWACRGLAAQRMLAVEPDSVWQETAAAAWYRAGMMYRQAGCGRQADQCEALADVELQHRVTVGERWLAYC